MGEEQRFCHQIYDLCREKEILIRENDVLKKNNAIMRSCLENMLNVHLSAMGDKLKMIRELKNRARECIGKLGSAPLE